ncbi:MAG TPA: diacylglycerol kinase [Sphingobacteriaceae bacterium]|nr:diacylglycerol kinase [Sphingobacteriaceae bacterium]
MRNFLKGFGFAFKGIAYAFSTQVNFKVHVASAMAVCALGYYTGLDTNEWLWISTAILLVLVLELINTGIEVLVDLISPGYNPKAGIIKDLSSAAVLITGLLALIIGLVIFIPKYF